MGRWNQSDSMCGESNGYVGVQDANEGRPAPEGLLSHECMSGIRRNKETSPSRMGFHGEHERNSRRGQWCRGDQDVVRSTH